MEGNYKKIRGMQETENDMIEILIDFGKLQTVLIILSAGLTLSTLHLRSCASVGASNT